jgi:hypothetical protein
MLATFSVHGNALNSTNAGRGASLVGDKGLAFAQWLTVISRGASGYKDKGFAGQSSKQQTTCIQLFKMKGLRFSMGYLIPE